MTSQVLSLVFLLQHLGFVVNSEKTVLSPTHKIEFLGFTTVSIWMDLTLPYEKAKKIRAESCSILNSKHRV